MNSVSIRIGRIKNNLLFNSYYKYIQYRDINFYTYTLSYPSEIKSDIYLLKLF